MRLTFLLIAGLLFLTIQSFAQTKVNRQYFINLLNTGQYDKVFDSALKLRKQVYGKNAVIDYFIAKCLCLDGHKEKSTYCFNSIIKNHKLSGPRKTFIQQEISTCNAPPAESEQNLTTSPDFSYINNVSLPEASVGGKMGKVYDCYSGSQTINLGTMVSLDELESRLFAINQKQAAFRKVSSIVKTNYKIDTSGRYVFVTLKKYPLDSVNYAATKLEDAYRFFVKHYGLRAPDKLITVYILPNQPALRKVAQVVHGIKLPDPNIGYSNLSDLSLLGLGDAKHLGTLYHELFHLIIRTDLGDIPAFLDEGLASLYSVSKWNGDQLIGHQRPWRLEELKEAKSAQDRLLQIPPLEKLINYSWDEFDGQETKNVCQVAVNYALSNFLMIYLQEKNLLQQMVNAFKDRPFVPTDLGEQKTNLEIFNSVVKDSIENFTVKFDAWFKTQYKFNLYQKNVSSATTTPAVNMQQLFINAKVLLYETKEKVFQTGDQSAFKLLEQELDEIEKDYKKMVTSQPNNNNAPANMVQQSLPVDGNADKKIEIQKRLNEFEKKLREMLFKKFP